MISLFITILTVLVTVGFVLAVRKKMFVTRGEGYNRETVLDSSYLIKGIVILVVGLLIALFQPYSVQRVDAGTVGVKVNLTGHDRGISDVKYVTGWVVINSYVEELYEFPTFKQHIEYEDQPVILKGGFTTTIQPTFNYKLKKDVVTEMFAELRLTLPEIEQGWLKTAIKSSIDDVANKWEVDEIFNNREEFENEIIAMCNMRIGMWFEVELLRTNIVPPPSLEKSIENQVKAIKDAQAIEMETLVTIENGKKKVAQAKADSAEAVINASGQAKAKIIQAEADAKAIQLKQKEITSQYVDYIRASRWDGKYPTTMTGSGTGILLDAR